MEVIDLIGYIAKDATTKTINNKTYTNFDICIAKGKKADGKTDYNYYSVMMYYSEKMLPSLTRGKVVHVRGRYTDNIYTTQQGESKIGRTCWASEFDFVAGGQATQQQQQTQQYQAPQTPYQQPVQTYPQQTDLPF